MKNKSLRSLALIIIALLAWAGLVGSFSAQADSTYSIFGARLGMSGQEIGKTLGHPTIVKRKTETWGYRNLKGSVRGLDDPQLVFKNDHLIWIAGSRLECGGQVVLQRGQKAGDILKVLGKCPSFSRNTKNGADIYAYPQKQLTIIVMAKEQTIAVIALGTH